MLGPEQVLSLEIIKGISFFRVSKTRGFLITEEIFLQICSIGISPLLPVTPVIRVIGQLDLLDPLDPLVTPFVLCDQLERVATLGRERQIIHPVGHDDIVVHQVVERE
jgi:hypothetical protein